MDAKLRNIPPPGLEPGSLGCEPSILTSYTIADLVRVYVCKSIAVINVNPKGVGVIDRRRKARLTSGAPP